MRSASEIRFRLWQETANASFWLLKPARRVDAHTPLSVLPDPASVADSVRQTPFAADVLRRADELITHRFPILGLMIETGPDIRWRRDYLSGQETDAAYFKRIPYLDATRAGDHKVIWELNRHQHLVLLAQAWLLSGHDKFIREIEGQLDSWLEQNPFQCGINWASALEVAFRALSWIWVFHFAGGALSEPVRSRFLSALYQHGLHLEFNLSYYFSRNTHLLGEAVALHALGVLFPGWPRSQTWMRTGAEVVRAELDYQVLPDGAHFEQSSYYHVYALDFFLLHYLLAERPANFEHTLSRMAGYLDMQLGIARAIPFFGDDDAGRLFHPYGCHAQYGRATLATAARVLDRKDFSYRKADLYTQAAWWLGPDILTDEPPTSNYVPQSRVFSDSGLIEMCAGEVQVLFDAGGFGAKRGGHSHSDTLSLVARRGEEEILIDAGTYTYVGDPVWRNRFRGSAMHNTLRVDGGDQGEPAGPFGWLTKPTVERKEWISEEAHDYADAECRYNDVVLRRRVLLLKHEALLIVLDRVDAPSVRTIEQFWHFASAGQDANLTLSPSAAITSGTGGLYGWRSRALGRKEEAPYIYATVQAISPVLLVAVLSFTMKHTPSRVSLESSGDDCVLSYTGEHDIAVRFSSCGTPLLLR